MSIEYTPEKLESAVQFYDNDLAALRKSLDDLYVLNDSYESTQQTLTKLTDKVRHPIMVPLGPHAFMPGHLHHTNDITVLLGSNYYAHVSAKQASAIVERRKNALKQDIKQNQSLMEQLLIQRNQASEWLDSKDAPSTHLSIMMAGIYTHSSTTSDAPAASGRVQSSAPSITPAVTPAVTPAIVVDMSRPSSSSSSSSSHSTSAATTASSSPSTSLLLPSSKANDPSTSVSKSMTSTSTSTSLPPSPSSSVSAASSSVSAPSSSPSVSAPSSTSTLSTASASKSSGVVGIRQSNPLFVPNPPAPRRGQQGRASSSSSSSSPSSSSSIVGLSASTTSASGSSMGVKSTLIPKGTNEEGDTIMEIIETEDIDNSLHSNTGDDVQTPEPEQATKASGAGSPTSAQLAVATTTSSTSTSTTSSLLRGESGASEVQSLLSQYLIEEMQRLEMEDPEGLMLDAAAKRKQRREAKGKQAVASRKKGEQKVKPTTGKAMGKRRGAAARGKGDEEEEEEEDDQLNGGRDDLDDEEEEEEEEEEDDEDPDVRDERIVALVAAEAKKRATARLAKYLAEKTQQQQQQQRQQQKQQQQKGASSKSDSLSSTTTPSPIVVTERTRAKPSKSAPAPAPTPAPTTACDPASTKTPTTAECSEGAVADGGVADGDAGDSFEAFWASLDPEAGGDVVTASTSKTMTRTVTTTGGSTTASTATTKVGEPSSSHAISSASSSSSSTASSSSSSSALSAARLSSSMSAPYDRNALHAAMLASTARSAMWTEADLDAAYEEDDDEDDDDADAYDEEEYERRGKVPYSLASAPRQSGRKSKGVEEDVTENMWRERVRELIGKGRGAEGGGGGVESQSGNKGGEAKRTVRPAFIPSDDVDSDDEDEDEDEDDEDGEGDDDENEDDDDEKEEEEKADAKEFGWGRRGVVFADRGAHPRPIKEERAFSKHAPPSTVSSAVPVKGSNLGSDDGDAGGDEEEEDEDEEVVPIRRIPDDATDARHIPTPPLRATPLKSALKPSPSSPHVAGPSLGSASSSPSSVSASTPAPRVPPPSTEISRVAERTRQPSAVARTGADAAAPSTSSSATSTATSTGGSAPMSKFKAARLGLLPPQ